MRRTFPILLAALLLSIGASRARAQSAHGPSSGRMIHFGVGGGVSVPTADARDVLENGFNGQAWVSLNPRVIPVTLRAAVDLQKSDAKDISTAGTGTVTTPAFSGGTSQVLAGLANVRVDLLHGAFIPYVTLGLGGYNVKTEATGAASESSTRFGLNGGAGLAARVGAIHLYLEGRVDNVYTERGVIDTKTVQLIPVTFGIFF